MSKIFKYSIQVGPNDIDELNHANNRSYLDWMIDAAVAHTHALGYNLEKFMELGGVFVVRRHEMDYLRPVYLGEQISVETWASEFKGTRSTREYQIVRDHDQLVVFKGKTLWVWVDPETGLPKAVPERVILDYS